MKRCLDILRAVLLSPEAAAVLLPFLAHAYAPDLAAVLLKPMRENVLFGLSAAGLAGAMLVFSYRESVDLLSPSGARRVLLEWPDYPMLKGRVLVAFGWCGIGVIASLVGTWLVAIDANAPLGVAILAAGVFVAAVATLTVALARLRARELLRE